MQLLGGAQKLHLVEEQLKEQLQEHSNRTHQVSQLAEQHPGAFLAGSAAWLYGTYKVGSWACAACSRRLLCYTSPQRAFAGQPGLDNAWCPGWLTSRAEGKVAYFHLGPFLVAGPTICGEVLLL